MKKLPNVLLIVAALALVVGLIVRIIQSAMGVMPLAYGDPVFYWRGAMALVAIAIAIVLIQIRDK